MRLHISTTLSLPIDAATQTFAFVGRKGSGKTFGAGKLTELLIDHGVQVVILDSVGNWYGLRLAADGKHDGINIPILGGLRQDVPLESTGGALVADVVVDSGRSLIIDVSQFSKGDRQRFAVGFGERLWMRKKAERDPSPVHLVIEESQLIVPERVAGDTARMVGIFEEIIRLGRNYGIGVSMITQRPQSVSKEVLNQTECLMVFQVNGAHERKALKEWIVHQGMDVRLLDELPSLKAGDCYVWSPQWLEILQRMHIAPKRTLDSTSTPKVGAPHARQRELRTLNLDDLKTKMAATIERAKADDPQELRRRIAQLEQELKQATAAPVVATKLVDRPILTEKSEKAINELLIQLDKACVRVEQIAEAIGGHTGELRAGLITVHNRREAIATACLMPKRPETRAAIAKLASHVADNGTGASRLDGPERKLLTALAQYGERSVTALALLTGYAHSGGGFRNPLSRLRTKGFIVGTGVLQPTEAGLTALGRWEPLPSGRALLEHWLHRLPGPDSKLLRAISEVYPRTIDLHDLAATTGYEASGGAFRNPLSRLRSLGLVHGRGELRASEELF